MRTTALVAAVLGAAAVVVGLAVTPAAAQPSAAAPHHGSFAPFHGRVHVNPKVGGTFNQNGYNWSGEVTTGSGFSSVSASWTEPAVTCNSTNDLYAPWVGIDGYGSNSVEQTGVATDCSAGYPVYQAWYEMYPANPVYYSNPVSGGDSFTGKVTRSGSNYTLTITDNSRGWSKTVTKSYPGANASAEFILESPTAAYPRFGHVTFTSSTVNGKSLSTFGTTALDASNSGGYEDHTGTRSGGTFTVTYLRE